MYHIKNDKRAKQSSKLIFNALKSLLEEKPYDSISITQITQTANIGRATFYRNFDSVDDVLVYEIDKKFKMLQNFIQNFRGDPTMGRSMLRLTIEFWDIHADLIELLQSADRTYLLFSPMCSIIREYKDFFAGEKYDKPDMDFIIELRAHVITLIVSKWIASGKLITCQQLIKLAIEQVKRAAEINVL